jgi:predicted DCC family thiol-disulfide oxidoreductase YuxK
MDRAPKKLVLFDGVCNVCNAAVLFIVDRDPREQFVFASLQSELGQQVLRDHAIPPTTDSVVLVENGETHVCSTAALRIAKELRWPWPVFYYLFTPVPRVLRDAAYQAFARRRYALFGKSDQCRIPTPELRRRMLT